MDFLTPDVDLLSKSTPDQLQSSAGRRPPASSFLPSIGTTKQTSRRVPCSPLSPAYVRLLQLHAKPSFSSSSPTTQPTVLCGGVKGSAGSGVQRQTNSSDGVRSGGSANLAWTFFSPWKDAWAVNILLEGLLPYLAGFPQVRVS